MRRWTLRDRLHNDIYLTDERWVHILARHDELKGRLDNVLDTLRYGQRWQEPLDPQKYRYYRAYTNLEYGFNHIVVLVVFRYNDVGDSNNFVVTAWGAYIHSKG
jgi:hypothetical protein